jgi:hypothetical protein
LLNYALAEVQKNVVGAFVGLCTGGKVHGAHAARVLLGCRNLDLTIFFKIALVACDGDNNVVSNLPTNMLTRALKECSN